MTDEKTPKNKKSLMVYVSYNPTVVDYTTYLTSTLLEYYGTYFEHKKGKIKHTVSILFENIKEGEDFYKLLESTNLKITKEEVVQ